MVSRRYLFDEHALRRPPRDRAFCVRTEIPSGLPTDAIRWAFLRFDVLLSGPNGGVSSSVLGDVIPGVDQVSLIADGLG